ncbi:MAG: LysR family transcriptional regulator [Erysipelotrichaceae bacterium]|nr:LysR family transcriptional regulator [Erysipelotrichaceae bacterium]
MDNQKLKYFLSVADTGSFTKAARRNYISHNAIMKHINSLEQELGVPLFERSRSGVSLNKAGEVFYQGARRLLALENEVIDQTRSAYHDYRTTIRIGSSPLRPHNMVFDLWKSISFLHPHLRFRVVSMSDPSGAYYGSHEFFDQLGEDYDVVSCVYSSNLWHGRCQALKISDLPLMIGVPFTHPLAHKTKLKVDDLEGNTLYLAPRGNTEPVDRMRSMLEKEHPSVILRKDLTSLDTFNHCAENNFLMVSFETWRNVHPSFLLKEVDWDYTLPFGIIYANDPTPAVREFIEIMRTVISTE